MAKVTLRLYGRFAYASPAPGSREEHKEQEGPAIVAIAPRFDRAHQDDHTAFMTIRRDQVVTGEKMTTVKPTHKVITGGPQEECELWVWSLDGRNVSFEQASKTKSIQFDSTIMRNSPVIPDMGILEGIQKREPALPPESRIARPDPYHPVQAVIHLCGDGVVYAPHGMRSITFVTGADAAEGDPKDDKPVHFPAGTVYEIKTPDLVECSLTVAAQTLTISLPLGDEKRRDIVTIDTSSDVTVGFSNVCSELRLLRDEPYDLEFSQYYRLLSPNPETEEALIPRDALYRSAAVGEIVDCDRIVVMNYDARSGRLIMP